MPQRRTRDIFRDYEKNGRRRVILDRILYDVGKIGVSFICKSKSKSSFHPFIIFHAQRRTKNIFRDYEKIEERAEKRDEILG